MLAGYLPGLFDSPRQSTIPTVSTAGVVPPGALNWIQHSLGSHVVAVTVQFCAFAPAERIETFARARGPPSTCTSLTAFGVISIACEHSRPGRTSNIAATAVLPSRAPCIHSHLSSQVRSHRTKPHSEPRPRYLAGPAARIRSHPALR